MVEVTSDVRPTAQPISLLERLPLMRARAEAREKTKFMTRERIGKLSAYPDEVIEATDSVVRSLYGRLIDVVEGVSQKGAKEAGLVAQRLDHLSRFIDAFADRKIVMEKDRLLSTNDPEVHVYRSRARFEGQEYWVELEVQPRSGSRRLEVRQGQAEESEPGCEFRLIPEEDSSAAIAVRLDSETRRVVQEVEVREHGSELLVGAFGADRPRFDTEMSVDNERFAQMMEAINLWVRTS